MPVSLERFRVPGASDDATWERAFTELAGMAHPPALLIPHGAYDLTVQNLPLSDGMHVFGDGMPLVTFHGQGELFPVVGCQRLEIDHLDLVGTFQPNTCAIRHKLNPASSLANHYHHCRIRDFGDGMTGAGISIEGDSLGNELGPHLCMGNLTANIALSGPGADSLWVHHNVLSVPNGHPAGPTRAFDGGTDQGAATMKLEHNSITTEGYGAIRLTGNSFLLLDNEIETLLNIANASNASVEVLGTAQVSMERTSINLHKAAGADYCVYFADTVTWSGEANGRYGNYNKSAVRTSHGTGNQYGPSMSWQDPSTLYSDESVHILQRLA